MATSANSTIMPGRLSPDRMATIADLEAEFVMLTALRERTATRLDQLTLTLWHTYELPWAGCPDTRPSLVQIDGGAILVRGGRDA